MNMLSKLGGAGVSSIGKKDPFFVKLDQESKKLRDSAMDFADFLLTSDIKLPDKSALVESLKKIHLAPIDKIDLAIDDLKKQILMISACIDMMQKVDPNQEEKLVKQMETFLNKNAVLVEEVDTFVTKAFELNNSI